MIAFAYGVGTYLIFLLTFLYAFGFVGNAVVEHTIDGAPGAPGAGLGGWIGNACLLGLFAVQHSLMARPAFKRAWTRIVPSVVERSTYVLLSSLLMMLLFLRWTPIPDVVWDLGVHPLGFALELISLAGWLIVLLSTIQIGHFELFGLKQVWYHVQRKQLPEPRFEVPFFYSWVRHPIYVGFLLAFWATPRMTLGHLFFGLLTTGYILVAVRLEESDLARVHPEYRGYKARVPMFLPFRRPLPAPERK